MGRFFKRKKQKGEPETQIPLQEVECEVVIADENKPKETQSEVDVSDAIAIENEVAVENEVAIDDAVSVEGTDVQEGKAKVESEGVEKMLIEIRKILPPSQPPSCGSIVLTPLKHPKSIEEAGKMFLKMLKK